MISRVASGMASREAAAKKMSSSHSCPVIRFCAVVIGMTTKSSWSYPLAENPLPCSTPRTLNGTWFTLMVLPIGSSSSKRFVATVWPSTQTAELWSMSSWVNSAPRARSHLRISKYSGLTPRYCVPQFRFPYTTWMRPSTLGEALLIPGTCSRTARPSPIIKVLVPRVPMRTPLRARLPASSQIRLSPTLWSWSSTRLDPALPTPTTQMNAATPMMIPSIVSTLRMRLRPSAFSASRMMVLKYISLSFLGWPSRSPDFAKGSDHRMTRSPDPSLIPQRLNRVQARRFLRGIKAKENSNCNGHSRGSGDCPGRDQNRPAGRDRQHQRSDQSHKNSYRASDQAHHHGFGQELQLHIGLRGADSQPHADLARAFRNRNQHDVHDAQPADCQRDPGNRGQQQRHHLAGFRSQVGHVGQVAHREVVGLIGANAMPVAQQGLNLLLRGIAGGARLGRGHDKAQPRLSGDLLLQRGEGNDDDVILIVCHRRRLSFGLQYAGNCKGKSADADGLADRVGECEQVFAHSLADDGDVGCHGYVFVGKAGAAGEAPRPDLEILRRAADNARAPVVAFVNHLGRALRATGRGHHIGTFFQNRQDVGAHQRFGSAPSQVKAADAH